MGDKGFLHPCTLTVKNGTATVKLFLSEMSCRHKSVAGRTLSGRLIQLRYRIDSAYQEASITEDSCQITLERLEMKLDTHGNPRSGCLPVRVAASVGDSVMPESNARLIFNFRAMKKVTTEQKKEQTNHELNRES